MSSNSRPPVFVARIKPGISPVILDNDQLQGKLRKSGSGHSIVEESVTGSFLIVDGPNAASATSKCGRYLAAISGVFRLPDGISAHRSAADWLIEEFRNKGSSCLRAINGSWRIIFIDNEAEKTWIATDRMGSQRVCFKQETDGTLIVASSGETIEQLTSDNLSINSSSILDYFFFSCIPSPMSVFTSVQTLGPSQVVEYTTNLKISRYWTPDFVASASGETSTDPEQLLSTLRDAVKSNVANRSVAAFLSGGLDSSTVVGMAANAPDSTVNAYTIGFDEKDYDETPYARLAADYFDVPLSLYYVTPGDVMTTIDTVASQYDEPFGNSSAIPTYFCALAAANAGETMILAGDGGDELFAGNERYRKQQIFSYYYKINAGLRNSFLEPVFLGALGDVNFLPIRKLRRYIEQAIVPMPDRLQTYNFLLRDGLDNIFSTDFLDCVDQDSPLTHMRSVWDDANTDDLIDRMLFLDWKLTLADNDLRKVTTMCEAAGIEVSFPMLDNNLLELSCQISGTDKMRKGKLRGFYKEATRNFLPNEILSKPKHGFGLPFGPWFSKSEPLRLHAIEMMDSFAERNIVKRKYIDGVRDATIGTHPGYFGEMIWLIVILESWLAARPKWSSFKV